MTQANYAAETFSGNRLNALFRPVVAINHGRKWPLILTNDIIRRRLPKTKCQT
jgi:hypothetical protein